MGVDWGEYFGTEDPDEIDDIMYEESLYAIENPCEEKEKDNMKREVLNPSYLLEKVIFAWNEKTSMFQITWRIFEINVAKEKYNINLQNAGGMTHAIIGYNEDGDILDTIIVYGENDKHEDNQLYFLFDDGSYNIIYDSKADTSENDGPHCYGVKYSINELIGTILDIKKSGITINADICKKLYKEIENDDTNENNNNRTSFYDSFGEMPDDSDIPF